MNVVLNQFGQQPEIVCMKNLFLTSDTVVLTAVDLQAVRENHKYSSCLKVFIFYFLMTYSHLYAAPISSIQCVLIIKLRNNIF